jgi:GST-like protein
MKLYTWTTPNDQKVMIMLEELGVECYLDWVDIGRGEQHTPQYTAINPNATIPTLVDGAITVFESAAIMTYLAEKTGRFLPLEGQARYETIQWTYFQMANVGPMMGQAFRFQKNAPGSDACVYFVSEVDRLLSVADAHLADREWFAAGEYTIADMALYPWVRGAEVLGLSWEDYPNVARWCGRVGARPAVERALNLEPGAR